MYICIHIYICIYIYMHPNSPAKRTLQNLCRIPFKEIWPWLILVLFRNLTAEETLLRATMGVTGQPVILGRGAGTTRARIGSDRGFFFGSYTVYCMRYFVNYLLFLYICISFMGLSYTAVMALFKFERGSCFSMPDLTVRCFTGGKAAWRRGCRRGLFFRPSEPPLTSNCKGVITA